MECQPITVYCRVRKVEKQTGRILATTYTKKVDENGNYPNAGDVYNEEYAQRENIETAYLVFECSEEEYLNREPLKPKDEETKFLVEYIYEEIRLAEFNRDYTALISLIEQIPRKKLVEYLTM